MGSAVTLLKTERAVQKCERFLFTDPKPSPRDNTSKPNKTEQQKSDTQKIEVKPFSLQDWIREIHTSLHCFESVPFKSRLEFSQRIGKAFAERANFEDVCKGVADLLSEKKTDGFLIVHTGDKTRNGHTVKETKCLLELALETIVLVTDPDCSTTACKKVLTNTTFLKKLHSRLEKILEEKDTELNFYEELILRHGLAIILNLAAYIAECRDAYRHDIANQNTATKEDTTGMEKEGKAFLEIMVDSISKHYSKHGIMEQHEDNVRFKRLVLATLACMKETEIREKEVEFLCLQLSIALGDGNKRNDKYDITAIERGIRHLLVVKCVEIESDTELKQNAVQKQKQKIYFTKALVDCNIVQLLTKGAKSEVMQERKACLESLRLLCFEKADIKDAAGDDTFVDLLMKLYGKEHKEEDRGKKESTIDDSGDRKMKADKGKREGEKDNNKDEADKSKLNVKKPRKEDNDKDKTDESKVNMDKNQEEKEHDQKVNSKDKTDTNKENAHTNTEVKNQTEKDNTDNKNLKTDKEKSASIKKDKKLNEEILKDLAELILLNLYKFHGFEWENRPEFLRRGDEKEVNRRKVPARLVMLSYQKETKTKMEDIKLKLEEKGLNLWLRKDCNGKSHADLPAVESASIVLIGVTDAYKQCLDCRKEAHHAQMYSVPVIPLKLDDNSQSRTWYGISHGNKAFDFSKEISREALEELVILIEKLLKENVPKDKMQKRKDAIETMQKRNNIQESVQKENNTQGNSEQRNDPQCKMQQAKDAEGKPHKENDPQASLPQGHDPRENLPHGNDPQETLQKGEKTHQGYDPQENQKRGKDHKGNLQEKQKKVKVVEKDPVNPPRQATLDKQQPSSAVSPRKVYWVTPYCRVHPNKRSNSEEDDSTNCHSFYTDPMKEVRDWKKKFKLDGHLLKSVTKEELDLLVTMKEGDPTAFYERVWGNLKTKKVSELKNVEKALTSWQASNEA